MLLGCCHQRCRRRGLRINPRRGQGCLLRCLTDHLDDPSRYFELLILRAQSLELQAQSPASSLSRLFSDTRTERPPERAAEHTGAHWHEPSD
jgi:hypothetical protein